ncbi:hypothetical protein PM082_015657 [Marasmius tenuissimus]|nr:hypothetical protein PM082_015657 [Marasmius tenuissimus]
MVLLAKPSATVCSRSVAPTLLHHISFLSIYPTAYKIPYLILSLSDPHNPNKHPEAQRLLGFNPLDQTYLVLPPVLFRSFNIQDPNGLFHNEEMYKFGKVLLFGPQSITPNATKTKKTYGQLWNVKSTTPGLIAFIAVFVCFLFSKDKEFTKSGQIKYANDFDYYKKTLIVTAGSPHIQKTLALWNKHLFGTALEVVVDNETNDNPEVNEMLKVIGGMGSDDKGDATPIASAAPSPPLTPTATLTSTPTPDQTTEAQAEDATVPTEDIPAPQDKVFEGNTVPQEGGQTKCGGATAGKKVGRGRGVGGGKVNAPGAAWGGGAGTGRGCGGRRKAQALEIATDEEVPEPQPIHCLTHHGASSNLKSISVECHGDEEESE